MPLFDIFKKKKEAKKPTVSKKPEKAKPKEVAKAKPAPKSPPKKARKATGIAYRILKTPHVSEKATDLVAKNKYVFKIWPRANKTEVKKAVEGLFGVEVLTVRIVSIPRRKRRMGRIEGWRKGYKKAIVKIKEGQKIEVLSR